MPSLVLPIASFAALCLLILHSLYRRGGRVTAAFFIGGAAFGVLRGNVVWAICQYALGADTGATPYLPQGRLLPHIAHESPQVVIGWLFAAYLAWTLSEFILRRIRREDRLFPTVALSALFMACMSYCMESTAPRAGWWYWDFSTVNPYFGHAPLAGIAAWFSVATDFLFPVLLIEGTVPFLHCRRGLSPQGNETGGQSPAAQHRASRWRWLALLVFPLHMGAHALYNVVPGIDNVHVVMVLLVVGLALFNRTRLVTGLVKRPEGVRAGAVDLLPAISVATFLAVILYADLWVARDAELACTAIPLAVFALAALTRPPVLLVAACAALGVAAWPWVGARSLYAFAPPVALAALFSLDRAKNRRMAGAAWMAAALVLAGLFVAGEVSARARMGRYVGLLRQARAATRDGKPDVARSLRENALRMTFRNPDDLWWSVRHLLAENPDNTESLLPEIRARDEAITQIDPRWTGAWLEWAGWLAADNRIAEAIEKTRVAVEVEPTVGAHRAILGYFLLREGKTDEARQALTAAIDLGDEAPETRINLAVACTLSGDARRAEELLGQVLTADPSDPVAQLDMEHLRTAPAKLRADLAHLTAPAMYDFLGFLMFQRADRKVHEGDVSAGAAWAAAAAHYVPRSAEYRTNYAVFLAKGGALEDAVDQCELAARLDGRNQSARRNLVALCVNLARQQYDLGRYDAARKTLQRALLYAPREALDGIQRMLDGLPDGFGTGAEDVDAQ